MTLLKALKLDFPQSDVGWTSPEIKKKREFDQEENAAKFLVCVAISLVFQASYANF